MSLTDEGTSRQINTKNFRLHYNEAGKGPPLICLHGGGPGASAWSNFQKNIDALSRRFQVILLDLPGFGKSANVVDTSVGRFTFYARAVSEFIDAAGIGRPHMLGNSLGGATCLRFALDYPEKVNQLVLMGPTGLISIFTVPPARRMLFEYYKGTGPSREKMREWMETMVSDQSLLNDELLDERYEASIVPEILADPPQIVWQSMPPEELWPFIHRVQHKSLVIWGRDDRAAPLDAGVFAVQRMSDARLHVLPRCGHWSQWEKANEFNDLVLNFLE